METGQNTRELSRVSWLQNVLQGYLPGWQLCPGISGSFRLEWVAALLWNQWQAWRGIRASLNDETRHLISAGELALLKPTAYLINVSRGYVVDEDALVNALYDRRIAGAGLDVFETEPLPENNPLWSVPGTLITPHVTPQVPDRTGRSLDIIEENVRRFLVGEQLLNQLQPADTYTIEPLKPKTHWLLSRPWLPGKAKRLIWKLRDRFR